MNRINKLTILFIVLMKLMFLLCLYFNFKSVDSKVNSYYRVCYEDTLNVVVKQIDYYNRGICLLTTTDNRKLHIRRGTNMQDIPFGYSLHINDTLLKLNKSRKIIVKGQNGFFDAYYFEDYKETDNCFPKSKYK